jgi:hypothetical protein
MPLNFDLTIPSYDFYPLMKIDFSNISVYAQLQRHAKK